MIDERGYRPNVGIVLCNGHGQVFWARRSGRDGWQFPQGGIRAHESPEQAMFRELHEEVGLQSQHVAVLGCTRDWLHYDIPSQYLRRTGTYKSRGSQDAIQERINAAGRSDSQGREEAGQRREQLPGCAGAAAGSDRRSGPFRGQKQMWFLLRLVGRDQDVRLDASDKPEFDAWRWIDYWGALEQIIAFKREVYQQALTELEPLLHERREP